VTEVLDIVAAVARRRRGARRFAAGVLALALALAGALLLGACGGATATPAASPTPTPRATPSATARASATAAPTATPASAAPTPTPVPTPAPPASDLIAYVAVSNGALVPVDVTTGIADAPLLIDPDPTSIAITPDGRYAYVGDGDTGTVTPISLANGTVGTPNQVASAAGVTALALTPSGATLLAVVNPTGYDTGSVVPITLASGAVGAPIPVGADPVAIAVTPDGGTAYVVNAGDGTITPISLAGDTPGVPISVGVDPIGIAITPSGGTAYVLGGNGAGTLTPVTLAANPAQDVVGTAIAVPGGAPKAVANAPDGNSAFVLGGTGVARISLPAGTELFTTSNASYTAAAFSPDGTRALLGYTSGPSPSQGVMVMNVGTDLAGTPIALSGEPVSIAFRP
jgi:DNA-binding beta-propeller fold protein YncE